MSGGTACKCGSRDHWYVIKREHNRSAFNGYRWTPSAYSQISCNKCRAIWSTKAKYVASLPDAPPDWPNNPGVQTVT